MDLDAEAQVYAEADFEDVNAAFVEDVLSHCSAQTSRALDLGTGPGDIPLAVACAHPAIRIAAVDASMAMLRIARRKTSAAQRRVRFVLADALTLPFSDNEFDLVFSNSILHHVRDSEFFWREINRVSQPGAAVLVRDLLRPDSEDEARTIVAAYASDESKLLQEEFYRSLLSAYTVPEIEAQLCAAGMEGLSVAPVSDRHVDVAGCVS